MNQSFSRGRALKCLTLIPAVAAGLVGALTRAADAGKGSKAQFKYQDKPKNGQPCAACKFYIANKKPKANGSCSIVAGSINPKGWCIAWAKK